MLCIIDIKENKCWDVLKECESGDFLELKATWQEYKESLILKLEQKHPIVIEKEWKRENIFL